MDADVRPPPPSVSSETSRLRAVRVLRRDFDRLGVRLGLKASVVQDLFEGCLMAERDAPCASSPPARDPLLPRPSWVERIVEPSLRSRLPVPLPETLGADLDLLREATSISLATFDSLRRRRVGPPTIRVERRPVTGKAARRASLERDDPDLHVYLVSCSEEDTSEVITFRIMSRHYDKLKRLYDSGSSDSGSAESRSPDSFRERLFCVLARYCAVRGGGFKGGGMQSAAPETVFDVLRKRLGVSFECFASPLNCRYDAFCSAFVDVDRPFGSVGSFWRFRPNEGSFQANPPFDRAIITRCARRVDELLRGAGRRAMSFVVMVPRWTDNEGWKAMSSSRFRRETVELSRRRHGYCEGLQHSRPTRYRIAPCDTSVFVLQTDAGYRTWPPSASVVKEIREAFRSKHVRVRDMVAARKGKLSSS